VLVRQELFLRQGLVFCPGYWTEILLFMLPHYSLDDRHAPPSPLLAQMGGLMNFLLGVDLELLSS
jgi:hypothetical protein